MARGIKRRFEERSNELIALCVTRAEKEVLVRLAAQKHVSLSTFIIEPLRAGILKGVAREFTGKASGTRTANKL